MQVETRRLVCSQNSHNSHEIWFLQLVWNQLQEVVLNRCLSVWIVPNALMSFPTSAAVCLNNDVTELKRHIDCFLDNNQWWLTSWCFLSLVKLSATMQLASGDDFTLNLHLLHPVAPQQCSFKVLSTKVWLTEIGPSLLLEQRLLTTVRQRLRLRPLMSIKHSLGKNSSAMHKMFLYSCLCNSEAVWIHYSTKLMLFASVFKGKLLPA